MVKDGEDWHGLQTTKLKSLAKLFKAIEPWHSSFNSSVRKAIFNPMFDLWHPSHQFLQQNFIFYFFLRKTINHYCLMQGKTTMIIVLMNITWLCRPVCNQVHQVEVIFRVKWIVLLRASIVWNLLTPDLVRTSNIKDYTRMAFKSFKLCNLDFQVGSLQTISHNNNDNFLY